MVSSPRCIPPPKSTPFDRNIRLDSIIREIETNSRNFGNQQNAIYTPSLNSDNPLRLNPQNSNNTGPGNRVTGDRVTQVDNQLPAMILDK